MTACLGKASASWSHNLSRKRARAKQHHLRVATTQNFRHCKGNTMSENLSLATPAKAVGFYENEMQLSQWLPSIPRRLDLGFAGDGNGLKPADDAHGTRSFDRVLFHTSFYEISNLLWALIGYTASYSCPISRLCRALVRQPELEAALYHMHS